MLRLIEHFRVRDPDGRQHTVACYQESYDRPVPAGTGWERVDTVRSYRLDGGETVDRVDDDTFLTASGIMLRRERGAPG